MVVGLVGMGLLMTFLFNEMDAPAWLAVLAPFLAGMLGGVISPYDYKDALKIATIVVTGMLGLFLIYQIFFAGVLENEVELDGMYAVLIMMGVVLMLAIAAPVIFGCLLFGARQGAKIGETIFEKPEQDSAEKEEKRKETVEEQWGFLKKK